MSNHPANDIRELITATENLDEAVALLRTYDEKDVAVALLFAQTDSIGLYNMARKFGVKYSTLFTTALKFLSARGFDIDDLNDYVAASTKRFP